MPRCTRGQGGGGGDINQINGVDPIAVDNGGGPTSTIRAPGVVVVVQSAGATGGQTLVSDTTPSANGKTVDLKDLVAGTNITLTPVQGGDGLEIAAAGGGGGGVQSVSGALPVVVDNSDPNNPEVGAPTAVVAIEDVDLAGGQEPSGGSATLTSTVVAGPNGATVRQYRIGGSDGITVTGGVDNDDPNTNDPLIIRLDTGVYRPQLKFVEPEDNDPPHVVAAYSNMLANTTPAFVALNIEDMTSAAVPDTQFGIKLFGNGSTNVFVKQTDGVFIEIPGDPQGALHDLTGSDLTIDGTDFTGQNLIYQLDVLGSDPVWRLV